MKLAHKLVQQYIKGHHLIGIRKVLDGEESSFSSDWLFPDEFYDILKKYGVNYDGGDADSNGWDYDYYHTIEHNGKSYFFQFSGFYGGASFELSEECL